MNLLEPSGLLNPKLLRMRHPGRIEIGLVIGVIVVLMYFPIFQLAGSIR